MDAPSLDQKIATWRNSRLPPCPDEVTANVLRRLRPEPRSPVDTVFGGDFFGAFLASLRPATFAVAFLAAVVTGFASAAVYSVVLPAPRTPSARTALGFDTLATPLELPTDHP